MKTTHAILAATLLVAVPALTIPAADAGPDVCVFFGDPGGSPADPVHCLGLCSWHDDGTFSCRP